MLIGQTLGDRYQIRRELGRGAMGTVFEARHLVLGKRLAVKVLRESCKEGRLRERFFHEARAASAVDHENIVSVVDFGLIPDTGNPYLVMEYVDGESLDAFIKREAPCDVETAVEITSQLLAALSVVHGAGLVHRDIKPANLILVRGRPRRRPFVKLLDFGIAGVLDHEAWRRPQLTTANQLIGTPAYLTPEQLGGGPVSPLWDLWAAAMVLYELLTAKLPFEIKDMRQLAQDIGRCNLVPIELKRSDLPPWVVEVMRRAQHRDPLRRFPSAVAFLQSLDQRRVLYDDHEMQTTPFFRVAMHTPPPELLGSSEKAGRMTGPPDAQGSSATRVLPKSERSGAAAEAASLARDNDLPTAAPGEPATRPFRRLDESLFPTLDVPGPPGHFWQRIPPPLLWGGVAALLAILVLVVALAL